MIKKLAIKNFKSLRDVKLNCARINIFIGHPNAGKSNILEAIGVLSSCYYGYLWDFVRAGQPFDLFFGRKLDHVCEVIVDKDKISIEPRENGIVGIYEHVRGGKSKANRETRDKVFDYGFSGHSYGGIEEFRKYKFYRFGAESRNPNMKSLCPPGGGNLPILVYTNESLRKLLQGIFSDFGLKLSVERRGPEGKHELKVLQDSQDLPVMYPWDMVSDTLQRMVFLITAMVTNKDSVLAFEEPEAHAFPYYTKFLAERIAMDESNQYFMTTHNPYFLMSILGKTPKKQLACFVVDMRNYETVVKKLTQRQIEEILDETEDAFFSVDKYFGDEE